MASPVRGMTGKCSISNATENLSQAKTFVKTTEGFVSYCGLIKGNAMSSCNEIQM